MPWVELTRKSIWPSGSESLALCTISSAKGLEFDHVFMPGMNAQVTPHGDDEGDVHFDRIRRLVAMGIGRARKSVMMGYKPGERSAVFDLLDPETYTMVEI
jgi:superfamily I DNA/RNA helicase